MIDNNWKLLHNPGGSGQCDFQPQQHGSSSVREKYMLFDLDEDPHELHDVSTRIPMGSIRQTFLVPPVRNSQEKGTGCAAIIASSSSCEESDDGDSSVIDIRLR